MNTSNLSESSGVYIFRDKHNTILYIGKAINIRKRVKSYFSKSLLGPRTKRMVSQIDHIETIKTTSEFDALLLEAQLINLNQPKYNIIWRDDKHPLYIKISGDTYPKVSTSRKEDEKDATYFGPFMSSSIVRDTLKFLREVVPFCTDGRIKKKPCFHAHIGLCSPCPNTIETLPSSEKAEAQERYRHNIRMLKKILTGKSNQVISDLTRAMATYAKNEDYRNAALIKKRLEKLQYLTRPRISIREYLQNPNLISDVRGQELKHLARTLDIPSVSRIEGYDISNIMGTNATGSMVVFAGGEPDKASYRKFRIKFKKTPDDFYMMQEVIARRLNHDEWPMPDLFLIDGGKGQVAAVLDVFNKNSVEAAVVGLAKRFEELILPIDHKSPYRFKTIKLSEGSPGLRLVQRVRNEAHRFAKSYHLKLRSKQVIY